MNDICPICKSDKRKEIGTPKTNKISSEFLNKDYKVVQCLNCELYYASPPIDFSNSQWTDLYNTEYFANQSNFLLNRRKRELSKRFDNALKFYSKKSEPFRYLDIGAGEGKGLIEAVARGWEATGIDIVDNRIEEAKLPGINFIKSNLLDSKLQENYFDFIYVDSVVEHVLNPYEYLSKIKNLLRAGGVIYIGVPNEDCLFNSVRRLVFNFTGKKNESEKIKPFDSPYHVIGFNKNSLKSFFNDLELNVLKFRNFGRKFEFLSYSPNNKSFWINLFFLLPIEYAGFFMQKDIYLEAYLTK